MQKRHEMVSNSPYARPIILMRIRVEFSKINKGFVPHAKYLLYVYINTSRAQIRVYDTLAQSSTKYTWGMA